MRTEPKNIPVPATVTRGEAIRVVDLWDKFIQFEGMAGAESIQIDGRARPGGGWEPINVPITADGRLDVLENVYEVCANRLAIGSGTPILTLLGRDGREP